MDKLQPLIKHRFWILLGLVPVLGIFGYYSANGAIKAATQAREEQLAKTLQSVPNGTEANSTWQAGLSGINGEYDRAVKEQVVRVWEEQQARMTWPASIRKYVPADYRGEFPDEAGFIYRDEYHKLREALYQSVEPIEIDHRKNRISGKVQFQYEQIPFHQFGPLTVTSEEMWDAQEDLWFLRLLFEAVRNVNESAENAAKSVIRRINTVKLRGGTGQSSVEAMAGGTEDPYLMDEYGMGDMSGMGSMGGTGGFRGGATLGPATISFDPSEEFGTEQDAAAMGGSGDFFADGYTDMGSGMMGDGMMGDGMMGSGMMGGMGIKPLRYIQFDETKRFRERGFYLSVLIDQKRLPDFLVELSNADWPIRIVRFQVGPNSNIPGVSPSSGTGGFLFAGGSGAWGGSGAFGSMLGMGESGYGGSGFALSEFESDFGMMDEYGYGGMSGMSQVGPAVPLSGDMLSGLFTHPDLVQLDLSGAITFYNPPPPEVLAVVTGESPVGDGEGGTAPAASDAPTSDALDVPGAAVPGEVDGLPGDESIPGLRGEAIPEESGAPADPLDADGTSQAPGETPAEAVPEEQPHPPAGP